MSRLGFFRRLPQEGDQTLDSILTVTLLAAKSLGGYQQLTFLGKAVARQFHQPLTDILGQGGRMGGIKAQLHRRSHFVHVLTAWAGGKHKLEVKFFLSELNVWRYGNHIIEKQKGSCQIPLIHDCQRQLPARN